jgi:hypothetical protein
MTTFPEPSGNRTEIQPMRLDHPGSFLRFTAALALTAASLACDESNDYGNEPEDPAPEATVLSATGDITAKVTEFRALLGDANGGTPGEQAAGRREIGWDGANANPFNNRNDFPATFFNTTATLGAVFATNGTGLRNDSTNFRDVDASYAEQFNFFSPTKIFSPVGSTQLDVLFQVAGAPTPAVVTGFGAIFSDVDRATSTKFEAFEEGGRSLGVFTVPARSDAGGLSFVGVRFDEAIIARVRITLGEAPLAAGVRDVSANGTADLVVVDNFIYGEPHAIQ